MQVAPLPANEQERVKALHEYQVLDTVPEPDFDDITTLAAEICHTPIAMVSFVDSYRQWFKSKYGLNVTEAPRDYSFCAHALHTPYEVFIVSDSSKDERFSDNPMVTGEPNIAFYAGVPLVNAEGLVLGTLCVADTASRELEEEQLNKLKSLGRLVVSQLEQRKTIIQLRHNQHELKNAYADLDSFSTIAAHDLKSPLNNIITISHLLEDNYGTKLDKDGNEYVGYLKDTAYQLSSLVINVLNYSRSSNMITDQKEPVNITGLMEEITGLIAVPENISLVFDKSREEANISRIALKQILLNLVDNAIKYNDKEYGRIEVIFHEDHDHYTFEVKDNGPGITEADQKKLFDLFKKLKNKSKDGKGTGVGLAIVKRLTDKLRGTIQLSSAMGTGTSFVIILPK